MKHQLLKWPPDGTTKCPHCKGSGKYRGLFSYGDCAYCDGSGLCDSNGDPLPADALIPLLRRHVDQQRSRHAALLNTPGVREAITKVRERAEQERLGYGMINRHQGD